MNTFQKLAITFLFIATGTNFIEAKKSWFKKTWKATADSANKSFSKKKWEDEVGGGIASGFTADVWEDGVGGGIASGFTKEVWEDGVGGGFEMMGKGIAQGFTDDVWDPNKNHSWDWIRHGWDEAFNCPAGMRENNKNGLCYNKCKNGQHFNNDGTCISDRAGKINNLLAHRVPVVFYTAKGGTVIPVPVSIAYNKPLEIPADATYVIAGPDMQDTNSTGRIGANVASVESNYVITVDTKGKLIITGGAAHITGGQERKGSNVTFSEIER